MSTQAGGGAKKFRLRNFTDDVSQFLESKFLLFLQGIKPMRKLLKSFLVLTFALATAAMPIAPSAALAAPQAECQECRSTWLQWFGNGALLVLGYSGLSNRLPALQRANANAVGWTARQLPTTIATAFVTFFYASGVVPEHRQ